MIKIVQVLNEDKEDLQQQEKIKIGHRLVESFWLTINRRMINIKGSCRDITFAREVMFFCSRSRDGVDIHDNDSKN